MDWIYEFLEEELNEKFGMIFDTDEKSDRLQLISDSFDNAIDAIREYASYGTPSAPNFGPDNSDKYEIEKLEKQIRLLERASGMSVEGEHVYEYGMEHVGGTISASYRRKVL